jgi:diaminohydroxyphosphoribosylaminopyrimidine deaminase / 5-amino-6-(5-phosphoribosylamino)uracil reductase
VALRALVLRLGAMQPIVAASPQGPVDEEGAWNLLREMVRQARSGEEILLDQGMIRLDPMAERGFHPAARLSPAVTEMLSLYLPICATRGPGYCVAHVGQSLDGQIATASGASRDVTGPENIRHLHRLRALCDAVLVGACTVERDDPQLTTRLVSGPNPVRVVIDPTLRLPAARRVYQDGAAPTVIVCRQGARVNGHRSHAEILEVPGEGQALEPAAILGALHRRGLRRLFIEGGGITVSRFLQARVLDRLHVTISPIFIGAGRRGLLLPAIDDPGLALRPKVRRFVLGQDVLFDCQLDGQR